MSWAQEGSAAPRILRVTFRVEPDGLGVHWSLSGVSVPAGGVVARLPLSLAGAPTIALPGDELSIMDELGPLPVSAADEEGEDGEGERV